MSSLRSAISALFALAVILCCASVLGAAQVAIPAHITEYENGIQGEWYWNGRGFDATWKNRAAATLTLESFVPSSVEIIRTDLSNTTSAGMIATYTGQISESGNSIANGTVTWTWPNHPGYPATGTWTASWRLPSPPGSSNAGKAYIASWGSNNIAVVDTSTNTVIKTIPVSAGARDVAVSQDGTRAYVTVMANLVYAIDTSTDSVIKIITVGGSPLGIAVLPSGSAVYVPNSTDGTVSVIDTLSLTVTSTLQLHTPFSYPTGLGVSPDGAFVYVSSSGGLDGSPYINVIRTSDNALVGAYKNPQQNLQIAISHDGATGYSSGLDLKSGTGNISVFSTRDGTILATIPMGSTKGIGVVLSPDGTIAYATDGNVVYVINTASNTGIDVISTGSARQLSGAMGLSISKDGSTLYVADGYNFLKVIDTKSHKLLTQVVVGSHPISIGSFLQPTIAVKARSPVPVPSVPIPAACGSASLLLTQPNAEHLCGNPELPFIYAHNANFHHYEDITDVCSKGQSANCTADTVFAILLRTPAAIAPVVSTVTASDIRSCQVLQLQGSCLEYDNKIQIVIDGTQRSVTNYTLPKHIFYPGQITRQIVEIDGRVKIKTIGLGVGCNQFFNKEAGTCKIWPDADQSLRIAVWKSLGLGGPPSIGIPDAACRLVTTIGGAVCNLF